MVVAYLPRTYYLSNAIVLLLTLTPNCGVNSCSSMGYSSHQLVSTTGLFVCWLTRVCAASYIDSSVPDEPLFSSM